MPSDNSEKFSENDEIIVFVDVSDSEQASDPEDDLARCIVGVTFGSDAISGIKDYKSTRANRAKRSLLKKRRVAERISKAIEEESVQCRVTLALMDGKSFYRFGQEMLDDLAERGLIEARDDQYHLEGETIPSGVARGLAGYAAALCFITTGPSQMAKAAGKQRVIFCLDKLPGSKNAQPSKLMRIVMHHPDFMPIWSELRERYDVEFNFADQWEVTDKDGNEIDAKQHPKLVFTDWIAQSAFASVNADAWKEVARNNDEDSRRDIAGPIFALNQKGWLRHVGLSRLSLAKIVDKAKRETSDDA